MGRIGSQININANNDLVSVQNPFPVDGDSVYAKDIDTANSSIGGFSGVITDLFDDVTSNISDSSATNPKTLTVAFNRPLEITEIEISTDTGDYSNVKILFLDSAGNTVGTIDDSATATKYTTNDYVITPTHCYQITIQFHTADTVTLGFVSIKKHMHGYVHLEALKPDGTSTFIDATNGGNLKISLEELESGISSNSNSQLNVTPFISDGTEKSDERLEIAQGKYTGITHINKFGRAENGVQTSATDIWDRADATPTQQIWTAPTTARIHQITSSSTADDGTPEGVGAGAQAVRIWGLTGWGAAEVSEDVTLNGTANVATSNSYVIIHRMKVIEVGSTYNLNVGNITATADTDGTVTAQISAGNGQTLMAIYGLPSTQTGYITNFEVNAHNVGNPSTAVDTDITMLVNERPDLDETVFLNKANIGMISSGNTNADRQYNPYKKVTGPAIIKFQGISSASDTEATVEFDMIIVDN